MTFMALTGRCCWDNVAASQSTGSYIVPTVAGTFPHLEAARAALHHSSAPTGTARVTMIARVGMDDTLSFPGVRGIRAAAGDGVQNRTETTTAGALLGLFVAGLVAYAPGAFGLLRVWPAAGPLRVAAEAAAEAPVGLPAAVVVGLLAAGALAGAWAGRGFGLPRGQAYRYSLQLRRGRVLVSVRVPTSRVAAIVAWLHGTGAGDVRVCSGRLRLRPGAQPDSLDLPAATGR